MRNHKKATHGKLSLSMETIRQLTNLDLGAVIGGGTGHGNGPPPTRPPTRGEPTAACTGNCRSDTNAE